QSIAAEQGEIDPPGIDSQGVDAAMLAGTAPQGREHFRVEPQDIPVHGAESVHRPVRKTVHDFQPQLPAVKKAEQAAAALRAQIDGEKLFHCLHARPVLRGGSQKLQIIVQWPMTIACGLLATRSTDDHKWPGDSSSNSAMARPSMISTS